MLAAKFIPLVLLGFSAGGAARHDDGRWGDRRPFRTAIPAVVLTACVLAGMSCSPNCA